MVAFYVKKIQTQQINPKTGAPWVLEDVPTRWYDAVAEALDNAE